MLYKNIKTGAVVDTPCVVSGDDWISVEAESKQKEEELKAEAEARKKEEALKAEADAKQKEEDLKAEADRRDSDENDAGPGDRDTVIDLSEMTVVGLKNFAAENNIDLGRATKKEDIIKAIAESDVVEVE